MSVTEPLVDSSTRDTTYILSTLKVYKAVDYPVKLRTRPSCSEVIAILERQVYTAPNGACRLSLSMPVSGEISFAGKSVGSEGVAYPTARSRSPFFTTTYVTRKRTCLVEHGLMRYY